MLWLNTSLSEAPGRWALFNAGCPHLPQGGRDAVVGVSPCPARAKFTVEIH